MSRTVLMATWGPIYSPGGKSERLRGYLDEFSKSNELKVHYFGLPDRNFTSTMKHAALLSYTHSRTARYAATLITKSLKPFGYSAYGRFIGTQILAYKAAYSKELKHCDVVFTLAQFGPLIKRAKKLGIPIIIEITDSAAQQTWNDINQTKQKLGINKIYLDQINCKPMVKVEERSITAANKLIVFSNFSEQSYLNIGIKKNKIIKLRPPLAKEIEKSYSLAFAPKFVCVASNPIRKGLHTVLSAWCKYIKNGGSGKLYLIGELAPGTNKLLDKFQTLKNIEFAGRVDFVNFFSEEVGILVFPSLSEGRPRTVLEAMTSGWPVIATAAGSADIIENGKNGYLTSGTAEDLHKVMVKIEKNWHNNMKVLSQNAHNTVINDKNSSSYYSDVSKMLIDVSN